MAYHEISRARVDELPPSCEHVAHAMLFSRLNDKLFGIYPLTSVIMVRA